VPDRRFPIGLIVIAPVVIGFGVYAFADPTEVPDPNATPASTATASDGTPTFHEELQTAIAAHPTETPTPEASPTPEATATVAVRGDFREGAWVRVNAGAGDCLNARNQPSLESEWVIVNTCLPHGFEGYLTGAPVEADGHWWWFLAGAGWVAEDYLQFVAHVDIRARTVPELAGRGRIAFVRGQSEIWVMDADGSGQRLLVPAVDGAYPGNLKWSPDGSKLAYTLVGRGEPSQAVDVIVIDVATGAQRMIEQAYGAEWSPDGTRIGVIIDPELQAMSSPLGLPAIIDVATGERTMLSHERFYLQDPPAFNHDGTMLLISYSPQSTGEGDTRRPRILITDLAGRELHAIDMPPDGFISRPRWSPVDNRIAFHESDGTTPRYVIYDLARGRIASTDVPRASDKIGGRCGSADMWLTAWSLDGRSLLYSFDLGDTGANGVWAWDLASGTQRIVPAINAGVPAPGPDGWFAFASWGNSTPYMFAGPVAGGFPTIITDGQSPAWSPVAP